MIKNEYSRMYNMETYFWWYLALHELVVSFIDKFFKKNNLNIFDAGCGTGRMIELLNEYGCVEGIDYSEEAINFSKRRGLQNIKIENLNTWDIKENKYDIIICLDVIYHSGIIDDIEIIRKFYSALKNNGVLILNNPAFKILKRKHDEVVSTKRRYAKRVIMKKIKNIGFNIEEATYRLPYLFIIILIRKLINKMFNGYKIKSDLISLPSWLNRLLLILNRIENKLILNGIHMPFGSSLFIVAKKCN